MSHVEGKPGPDDSTESSEMRKVLRAIIVLVNGLMEVVGRVVYSALRSVSYLGPLRAEPRRWYEISAEAPRSVGVRGTVCAGVADAWILMIAQSPRRMAFKVWIR